MLFGKIDYINLAPFHVFLKRYVNNAQFKQSIEYKKSYPSHINKLLKSRKVDAAFISSIESKNKTFSCFDAGIIAHKKIKSVLVKSGEPLKDSESATSNALAAMLQIDGEVIIGDKALRAYLQDPQLYIDLAEQWYKKYELPFVFARFCANKNSCYYQKLINRFLKKPVKIPYYMLKKYAYKRDIPMSEIKKYLQLVHYRLDTKSKKSLDIFLKH